MVLSATVPAVSNLTMSFSSFRDLDDDVPGSFVPPTTFHRPAHAAHIQKTNNSALYDSAGLNGGRPNTHTSNCGKRIDSLRIYAQIICQEC